MPSSWGRGRVKNTMFELGGVFWGQIGANTVKVREVWVRLRNLRRVLGVVRSVRGKAAKFGGKLSWVGSRAKVVCSVRVVHCGTLSTSYAQQAPDAKASVAISRER
jgi:hypothetical protein